MTTKIVEAKKQNDPVFYDSKGTIGFRTIVETMIILCCFTV
jgi:hypothetical protein